MNRCMISCDNQKLQNDCLECRNRQIDFTSKPLRVNANIGIILRVKLKVVKVVKFKYIYYIYL